MSPSPVPSVEPARGLAMLSTAVGVSIAAMQRVPTQLRGSPNRTEGSASNRSAGDILLHYRLEVTETERVIRLVAR